MRKLILAVSLVPAAALLAHAATAQSRYADGDGHTHHDHHAHHHMHGAKAPRSDYIRLMSPAGYDVVLGRKNPLRELQPEIIKDEKGAEIKLFRLTVKDVEFELFPGKTVNGWGFDGAIPGPTIRVKEGDHVRVVLSNETDTPHTLHVHGQIKPMAADGVPFLGQKPVHKGESYTYDFVAAVAGTHWYHCHYDAPHHVDMGMYGAFIVEPRSEPIKYDREYIMILDEWPTGHVHIHHEAMPMEGHEAHGIVTEHAGEARHDHGEKRPDRDYFPETFLPHDPVYDAFTINGRSFPFTEPVEVKTGERIRFRFINAGHDTHMMHLHAHKFRVVARDGAYVNEPQLIDVVPLGAAQRVDVTMFANNPGIWPFHCHRLNHIANEHIYPGGMLTFLRYTDFKTPDRKAALTKHLPQSRFQLADKGLYSVELLVNEGARLKKGKNKIAVIIHDYNDVDVEGATLTAAASTETGGAAQAAAFREKAGGLYEIDGFEIPSPGAWNLRISVEKNGVSDSTVFAFGDVQ